MCIYLFSRKNHTCAFLLGTVRLFVLTKKFQQRKTLHMIFSNESEIVIFWIRNTHFSKNTFFDDMFCALKALYISFIQFIFASLCAYSSLCVYFFQHGFHTCVLIQACASIRNSKVP